MATVTIYRITRTKTFQMAEQGEGYALRPWGENTAYYEGCDDDGEQYVLPDGYEVAMSGGGTEEIYDSAGRCCAIVCHSSGRPQLVSAAPEMPVLKLANMKIEAAKWAVQIPAADGGSETIGEAATAEEAAELARDHGVDDTPELYARLDYCEWHVGF